MNYFDIVDKISQSRLKKILVHPRMYMSKSPILEDGDKIHFVIGNAVDCLITEPEKFNDYFYVLSTAAPTGQIKDFIDKYHKTGSESDAFAEVNSKKYTLEWFKTKMEESDNQTYLESLKQNKVILDYKTYENIISIVDSLNNFTEYKDLMDKSFGKEIISQLEIMWEYKGVELKSKLDFIVIDFQNKTILPIDIKTIGDSTSSFVYSFWKRRYDFQAACYTKALEAWIHSQENLKQFKGFKILPFKFVVESSKYQGSPLIFDVSEKTFNVGLNGGDVDGRYYEGFEQALERLKWHLDNNIWDYTREQWEVNKTILI
jgi:hypothetical protein